MKILHIAHGSPEFEERAGGTERYAAAVARAQGAALLAPNPARTGGGGQPVSGTRHFGLGLAPPKDFRHTWSNPQADAAISAILAEERPDVVHVHHLAHIGFGAVELAQRTGAAVVLTLHDYHLPCARGQLVDRDLQRCEGPAPERCGHCLSEHLRTSSGLLELGRLAGALGLRSHARSLIGRVPPGKTELARITARLDAARLLLRRTDRVLSPSLHLGTRLETLGWLPPGGWHHQDLPLISPILPAPDPGTGPVRFLFVGHLIPTKGVDVLLEAWEEVEQAELVLRGPFAPFDGQPDWASKTRQRMKTSSGVTWCGPFQAEQRQAIYDQADVLVVPSTWEENSPLVIREALAAGLRIVASNVGGIGELAPAARRVPPDDPRALAHALNAEVSAGRGRRRPRHFPMERHLRNLTDHYRAAVLQRETTSGGPL